MLRRLKASWPRFWDSSTNRLLLVLGCSAVQLSWAWSSFILCHSCRLPHFVEKKHNQCEDSFPPRMYIVWIHHASNMSSRFFVLLSKQNKRHESHMPTQSVLDYWWLCLIINGWPPSDIEGEKKKLTEWQSRTNFNKGTKKKSQFYAACKYGKTVKLKKEKK